MNAATAIQVQDLSKRYAVGRREQAPATFYEALGGLLTRPLARLRELAGTREAADTFWALRGVSFEVGQGEVVGIVGRNGAGKSTLLKILSRITAPTEGRAVLRGRMSSLLEVGTGFHPELTGRENIFLNGAILGMTRAEIARQFDAIVAFAEIERFVDTAVKHYSSGMYVRLAFSVAAHLDPDILVIDEVLAVGDAAFQKRCLGKMRDVARAGRTVLFVSHNMAAVQALCTRALYLKNGRVALDGAVDRIVDAHLGDTTDTLGQPLDARTDRSGDGRLRFTGSWIENAAGERMPSLVLGKTGTLCLAYEAFTDLEDVFVAFDIRDGNGEPVTNCNTADTGRDFARVAAGRGVFRCALPRFPIRGGRYSGNIYCAARGTVADFIVAAHEINVEDGDFYGTGSLKNGCRVMLEQAWRCDPAPEGST
ncbi:ABC transporter ATP-binding protein [Ramlibacter sp.]|uniref:ABC transporter ATP-binding protein n=1 Tax=Ramlibacter sp. TaxID=1917967 RepID=UPI0018159970|nr:ABC transporter ATP-binding protein [Ramlibacter sp.]MBA2672856.1 ABC transporter ATP-binding protein [Ramlibacter sp.]